MKHRADIDGLRAIAVIAVVLFHVGITGVSGGFVGVDVFFVISGYLITGLILKDLTTDRFSIPHFYERRVRRILPALFTVLLFASVASYLLLPPEQLADFGGSLVATVLFGSNVLFWKETGYFKTPAEVKPLLHTWSLAVEEQFYIFYPLFLWIVARYFRKKYSWALLTVFGFSFALSVWGVHHNRTATFYLAPFRAWELLLGGLLAIEVVPPVRNRVVANALSALGFALTISSFVVLSRSSLFPGVNALYPTIGAALIIYTGSENATLVSKLLCWKPVVFVGLISYSLYLWHWVLIVLLKFYLARGLSNLEITGVIAASVAIAALSWRFIENPFRGRAGLVSSRRLLFATAGVASVPLLAFGFSSNVTNGLPGRFSRDALNMLAAKKDFWKRRPECAGQICRVGDDHATPNFLLWGDSHAGAIAPAIEQLAVSNKVSGFIAFNPSCPPILDLIHYNDDTPEACVYFGSKVMDFIKAQHITTVVLHARWALSAEGVHYKQEPGAPILLSASRNPADDYEQFAKHFRSTVRQLRAQKLNVTIIASVPEVALDVPTVLARNAPGKADSDFATPYSEFMERQARAFGVLSKVASDYGAQIIYPHEKLCDRSSCLLMVDNHPLYIDDNHLSVHGAMYLAPTFAPLLGPVASRNTNSHSPNIG